MVRSTLVTAWFLADWPTSTSPFLAKATTDGVVREPSEFAMTTASPPSSTDTTEFVVPRSIPTARPIVDVLLFVAPPRGGSRFFARCERLPLKSAERLPCRQAFLSAIHSTFHRGQRAPSQSCSRSTQLCDVMPD